MLQEVLIIRN